MKQYQSHKIVHAARIIGTNGDNISRYLQLEDDSIVSVDGQEQFNKVKLGGYYVLYPDGYASYSPAKAFEEGYKLIDAGPATAMPPTPEAEQSNIAGTYGYALSYLKAGHKMARLGWNGKGMWIEMQTPDAHSKMTLPYLYLNYPSDAQNTPGARVPWTPSQTDQLADDWTIVAVVADTSGLPG